MDVVGFALLAGAAFGALPVAIGVGLKSGVDLEFGALATALVAFVGAAALTALGHRDLPGFGELWPFLLAGAIAPGASQVLFFRSIRDIGASRAAVVAGAIPLASGTIAIVILGEPLRVLVASGTALIVAGGIALAWERSRPDSFRGIGVVLGLAAVVIVGVRDNVARWAFSQVEVSALLATATTLGAGSATILLYIIVVRWRTLAEVRGRTLLVFLPGGLATTVAYAAMLEALERGRVTIVAPLVATEVLWAVGLAALLIGRRELVGRELIFAAVLVVAGGALVGIGR